MLHAFIPLKPFTFFGNKCVKRVTAREDICMFSYFGFMKQRTLNAIKC